MAVDKRAPTSACPNRRFIHASAGTNAQKAPNATNPKGASRPPATELNGTSRAPTYVSQRRALSHGKILRKRAPQIRAAITAIPHPANGITAIASRMSSRSVLWLIWYEHAPYGAVVCVSIRNVAEQYMASFLWSRRQMKQTDEMRRPVSGRDAVYAPKLSTCSEAQEIKETGNEEG